MRTSPFFSTFENKIIGYCPAPFVSRINHSRRVNFYGSRENHWKIQIVENEEKKNEKHNCRLETLTHLVPPLFLAFGAFA